MCIILRKIVFLMLVMHSVMNAYSFSPPIATISPSGNNSSFIYTIKNPEERAIPIEITIYEFKKDINGVRFDGDEVKDKFLVYPAQFILKKNETRNIQIRWIGDPDIQIEEAFTVLCKELEIPMEKKNTNSEGISLSVNVLMNYAARLIVTPFEGNSEIVIDSIGNSLDENGKNQIVITCLNKGNIHGKLINYSFVIRPGSRKSQYSKFDPIILENADIPGMAEAILTNTSRRFVIPWPERLPLGQINIELVKNAK
jgi:P pilus assembly chaperone PapD